MDISRRRVSLLALFAMAGGVAAAPQRDPLRLLRIPAGSPPQWQTKQLSKDSEDVIVRFRDVDLFAIRAFSRTISEDEISEFQAARAQSLGGAGATMELLADDGELWEMGHDGVKTRHCPAEIRDDGLLLMKGRFAIVNTEDAQTKFMVFAVGDAGTAQAFMSKIDVVEAIPRLPGIDDDAVIAATTAFLEAKDVETLKGFVRDPERVSPLIDIYYAEQPYRPFPLRGEIDSSKIVYERGYFVLGVEDKRFQKVPVVISRAEGGGLVADWESFVGYCELPWEKALSELPVEPKLFRVRMKPDDYFNYGFTEEDYVCLKLTDRTFDRVLYGYVPRDSDAMESLTLLGAENPAIDFAIVKLRAPSFKAGKNQVEITEILQFGWILETGK